MEGSKPTFSVTVQEISTKTISIAADDWHEALMRAIKLHDYGAISASDTTSNKTEVNISVEGYPYEIHDTWNIEDVENHIEKHDYTFTPELTEGEKRQILARMEHDQDCGRGYNWQTLDAAIYALYRDRMNV